MAVVVEGDVEAVAALRSTRFCHGLTSSEERYPVRSSPVIGHSSPSGTNTMEVIKPPVEDFFTRRGHIVRRVAYHARLSAKPSPISTPAAAFVFLIASGSGSA
jgi:hypothetical protein